jgi:hypothetical protein
MSHKGSHKGTKTQREKHPHSSALNPTASPHTEIRNGAELECDPRQGGFSTSSELPEQALPRCREASQNGGCRRVADFFLKPRKQAPAIESSIVFLAIGDGLPAPGNERPAANAADGDLLVRHAAGLLPILRIARGETVAVGGRGDFRIARRIDVDVTQIADRMPSLILGYF